jgi:hypothetical protein
VLVVEPACQTVQLLEPSSTPYFPAEQKRQALIAVVEYFPALQVVHVVAPVPSRALVIQPAPHSVQLLSKAEPVASAYLPAAQRMHDVASVEAVEYCPAAQAVQVVAPVSLPLSVIEPAAQAQAVHSSKFDAVEYSPATHAMHELAAAAAPLSVREPAKHTSQYDCAPLAWKLPAWHSVHLV